MSSKEKIIGMKEGAKPTLVPKRRFPEFQEENGWKATKLNAISDPVIDRAIQGKREDVLSLSAEYGIILQSDFFGKKVAGDNSERYLKITRNDFVYNDRTTKASTFGTIKRLSKHAGGIVSPIYKCFRFKETENPVFWEWYFESGNHNVALAGLVNEGARAGRFNISITQFLSTQVWQPSESEQQRIAECLSSADEAIAAQARKVEALKKHKKGLMQELFPREGETQPRRRFPEFQNAGEWVGDTLGNVCQLYQPVTLSTSELSMTGEYLVYGANGIIGTHNEYNHEDSEVAVTCRGATCGEVTMTSPKSWITGNAMVVKPKTKKLRKDFIFQYFKNHGLKTVVSGSAQPQITRSGFAPLVIFFPTPLEQQRIAACLSSLDALTSAEMQKLEALIRHKRGLMEQLFPSVEETDG
jgi:type I restriction enzyme S subunit